MAIDFDRLSWPSARILVYHYGRRIDDVSLEDLYNAFEARLVPRIREALEVEISAQLNDAVEP